VKIIQKLWKAQTVLTSLDVKSYLLSHSYFLRCSDEYKHVFPSPDRARFEREKNIRLGNKLKNWQSYGKEYLISEMVL